MNVVRTFALMLLCSLVAFGCTDSLLNTGQDNAAAQAEVTTKIRHRHLFDQAVRTKAGKTGGETVGIILQANKLVERYKLLERYKLVKRYEFGEVFYGLAAEIDLAKLDSILAEMANDPDIEWVEPDIFTGIDPGMGDQNEDNGQVIPWGIDRIGATQSWAKSGDGSGRVDGVEVYVLDTGLRHADLNYVSWSKYVDTPLYRDEEGHGIHIGGIIGAEDDNKFVVGVAPGVNLHGIKVLDDNGETELSNVVAGIEYIIGQKLANPNTPMVMNMSFGADVGSTEYTALDVAVDAAVAAGITVVVAAGNDGIDASTVTPAHAAGAITVGAYDIYNRFAPFSNHGPAVDILAPGVDILSLALNSGNQVKRFMGTGTSMAAPHVTGAAALFLAENPNATPQQVKDALLTSAKPDVWDQPAGTTNQTVWVGKELTNIDLPPFYSFAVTSNGDLEIDSAVHIQLEQSGQVNANVFTNGTIKLSDGAALVEGFGYYATDLDSVELAQQIFQPNYNPTGLDSYLYVEAIEVPTFNATDYEHLADQSDQKNVKLKGHYDLGTAEDPFIWYVRGDVQTIGDVTFSGYGVIMATGKIDLKHDVTSSAGTGETTLGLYATGHIMLKAEGLTLAAHLFGNGKVVFKSNTTLYGNITAQDKVEFGGPATLYYRAPPQALTDVFWPQNGN